MKRLNTLRISLAAVLLFIIATACVGTLTTPYTDYQIEARTGFTRQYSYVLLRTVTADDTPFTAKTKYWENMWAGSVEIPRTWSVIEVAFFCYGDGDGDGDPNGATFDFKLLSCRPYSCAKTVYEGYAQCGELELSCSPIDGTQYNSGSLDPNESYKWVDTIDANGLGDDWNGEPELSGDTGTDTTGGLATISLDGGGHARLRCEITNMTGKPVTQIWAVFTGYH